MPLGWRRKILRLYSLEVATIHLLETQDFASLQAAEGAIRTLGAYRTNLLLGKSLILM